MLRECVAGCLGSIQSLSHQNVKLKMRLPEGSPARFVKIHGSLQSTRRVGGRDAEALLGDLRFGEKRGERENGFFVFLFLPRRLRKSVELHTSLTGHADMVDLSLQTSWCSW